MNLALLLRVNGEVEEANELDLRCLEGFDRTLGREHHYSLTCAINLASDLAARGETSQAGRLGQETLAQLRELLGVDHPLTLACANNLVVDLRVRGALAEAETLEADTFERYRRVLGEDHPDTTVALRGSGSTSTSTRPPSNRCAGASARGGRPSAHGSWPARGPARSPATSRRGAVPSRP